MDPPDVRPADARPADAVAPLRDADPVDAPPPSLDQRPASPDAAPRDLAPDPRDVGREALRPDSARPDSAIDAPPPPDLARGLIGYWRLDETAGTMARDSSPRANHGMLVTLTAASWTPGQVKGGLGFDPALGGLVVVPNATSLNPTAGVSAAAWIMAENCHPEGDCATHDGLTDVADANYSQRALP